MWSYGRDILVDEDSSLLGCYPICPGKWLTFVLNHMNTKMEELGSFETSVILKQSSRRNITEDLNLLRQNLKLYNTAF